MLAIPQNNDFSTWYSHSTCPDILAHHIGALPRAPSWGRESISDDSPYHR